MLPTLEMQEQFYGTSFLLLLRLTNPNSRNGKAERLSYDHKMSDEAESQRVKDAGCFVLNGRLGGSLAISRAFGDSEFKKAGLTAVPYISETKLLPSDSHLIIACDGVRLTSLSSSASYFGSFLQLWDVTTDQEAVDMVKSKTEVRKMSGGLLMHAMDHNSNDNITIMVLVL